MNVAITGSSHGIGLSIREHLTSCGHRTFGFSRGGLKAYPCDVSKWNSISLAAHELAGEVDHLDALVTCAGIQSAAGRTLEVSPEEWERTVGTNLNGTFFSIRAFAALLAKAPRRAKVICFTGGGTTRPRPRFAAYAASKTAVLRLVETIAIEESGGPLDINAIAPGGINTRLTDEVIAAGPSVVGEAEFASAQKQKASGGGSIDKVLALVDWLLSEKSDGISGRLIAAQWDKWEDMK